MTELRNSRRRMREFEVQMWNPDGERTLGSHSPLHCMSFAAAPHFAARGMPKSPSMFRQTQWMWLAPFWVLLNSIRKVGP